MNVGKSVGKWFIDAGLAIFGGSIHKPYSRWRRGRQKACSLILEKIGELGGKKRLRKLNKIIYDSPKTEIFPPFSLLVDVGTIKKAVMVGTLNQCKSCGAELSDRFGHRFCRNWGCHLKGLKQN
jgi:hypothetical protein